jgi:MoxR-like ATPase/CubicO group peptidase (beta-lactamase class C family)
VQFTPDLMPGDITGSLVHSDGEFVFRRGPVFTNLLLADEINRTPPKTQASLLEAMEERQVTVDGTPQPLPDPFVVCATQNPVEYEGTYPLPEAQLDRFLLKLNVGLPSRDDEVQVLAAHDRGFDPRDLTAAGLRPVAGAAELAAGRAAASAVQVAPEVLAYVVDLCRATRTSPALSLGVSPRGATALLATAKAWAWLSGRDYVTPDDVKALARPTLRHRIALRPGGRARGRDRGGRAGRRARLGPRPPVAAAVHGRSGRGGDRTRRSGRGRSGRVALTGRAALLALLGVLPVLVLPSWWTVLAVLVLLVVVALVDVALAAPVGALQVARSGATACRLGDSAEVALALHNPGPRHLRGVLRDAWVPSAGAAPRTHDLDVPAGQRRSVRTVLTPTRRGDRLPDRITVRSVGPLGVAARQGRHEVPWRVRVQPPFTSRKHLPERLSRLRQLDGAVAVRQRGQGTEFDTLRDYVEATTSGRSTGAPPPAARRWSSARGAPSATGPCCSSSTPAARPPAASATSRGSTRPSTLHCCSPRSRRAPATASSCWRSTACPGRRRGGRPHRRPAPHRRRHGRAGAGPRRGGRAAARRRGPAQDAPALARRALHLPRHRRARGGAAAPPRLADLPPHRRARGRRRPARRGDGGRPRDTGGGVRRGRRGAGTVRAPAHDRAAAPARRRGRGRTAGALRPRRLGRVPLAQGRRPALSGRPLPSLRMTTSLRAPTVRALLARTARAQRTSRVPSLTAGVVRGGGLAWSAGVGAVQEPHIDVQHRLGSISKTVTAVAVLRLRDEGLLDLDDPLDRHVGGTPFGARTVGQLLSHTAGLRSESPGPWWERGAGAGLGRLRRAAGSRRPAARCRAPVPLLQPRLRGARRAARGRPGAVVVGRGPRRGAPAARHDPHDAAPDGRAAQGWAVHPWADVLLPEPEEEAAAMAAAGQLWSTLTDLGRFAAFLLGDTGDVLSAATLEEMALPAGVDPSATGWSAYGLGLQVVRSGDRTLLGHGGSMPGFLASVFVDRDEDLGTVVLCNATSGLDRPSSATCTRSCAPPSRTSSRRGRR